MSRGLTKALLPVLAMTAMMGAGTDLYSGRRHRSTSSEPLKPREYAPPRERTEEERAARKLHKKRVKARKQARRRKGHH